MKTGLYQIFDNIATMPASPIVGFQREEAAVRWFQEVYSNKDTPVHKYPEDHTLLKLGEQDIESGAIDAHTPVPVYDGRMLIEQIERRATSGSAPAADNNGAANAAPEVLPKPTAEELSCQRCRKHYTMHINNGHCPDNTGQRFLPSAQLQAHYKAYLDSRKELQ